MPAAIDLDQPWDVGGPPAAQRGVEVRCEGVVHLYRTFAGHDVVALRGIDLTTTAGSGWRSSAPRAAASRPC